MRAALRVVGLTVFDWLLTSTTVKSALREIVAQVPTALCGSVSAAEKGVPPSLWAPLTGCGQPLQAAVRFVCLLRRDSCVFFKSLELYPCDN